MHAPTFVDLFAGAGGLSWGLESAGWKCVFASDWWSDAMDTYRANMAQTPTFRGDVAELTTAKLARLIDGKPDWVVGGPPCQGYSTVGRRDRTDPRNQLFLEFKRVVETVRPRGFVLENVLGLKDMRFVEAVREAFESLDYSVTPQVVSAARYGVPQLRRRVIFVGVQRAEGCHFVGVPAITPEGSAVTVWEAIGDLPPVGPGQTITEYAGAPATPYQEAMRQGSDCLQGHTVSAHPDYLMEAISHIPDGGSRKYIPEHLQPKSGYHNSYSRLASFAPAVAVTSNLGKPSATRCIHPFQNRGLSTREGARLQSFPDAFHFTHGVTSQRLQVANAVPPLLAAAIATALADADNWRDFSEEGAAA